MSENHHNDRRDTGLAIHRWLQLISTILVTVLSAMVIAGIDTWGALKAQSIRMEAVPGKVDKILDRMDDITMKASNHEWRITNLENLKRK